MLLGRLRAVLPAFLLLAASVAHAQVPVIDAPSAQALPGAGGIIVDIRTPKEIAATGRPQGAVAVPLQGDDMVFHNDFVAQVAKAVGDDRARPVALIDANGRRAEFAARLLAQQGFKNVLIVGEGMLGSNMGPGWLARGLPIEK